MVVQFVEDLLHLERRWNCLAEHGCPNCAAWDAKFVLREIERVIPYARFDMALHFRQVEIRSAAAFDEFSCVVKEIEAKIEQSACHGFAVDEHVSFNQMPAARSDYQHGDIVL